MKLTFNLADIVISAKTSAVEQHRTTDGNADHVYPAKPAVDFDLKLSGISYTVEFEAGELPAIYKEVLPIVQEIVPAVKDVFNSVVNKVHEDAVERNGIRAAELQHEKDRLAFEERKYNDRKKVD